jgi:hypothetical protein
MSDYSNTFGGAAKDTANSTVLGADHDTQYEAIATMSATKLDTTGLRAAVEAASDSNVFDDADHTKLNGAAPLASPAFTGDVKHNTTVLVEETVIGRALIADTTIGTSEAVEDTITVAIPAYWNSWDVDLNAAGWFDETGSSGGDTQLTVKIREGSTTGGTQLSRSIQTMGTGAPDVNEDFSMYGFQEGLTSTGNVTYVLTSVANVESGKYSIRDTNWNVTARRVT